jgi:hypothetical protein
MRPVFVDAASPTRAVCSPVQPREDSDDEFFGLFSPRPGAAGDDAKSNEQGVNDLSPQTGSSSLMLAQRLTRKKSEK